LSSLYELPFGRGKLLAHDAPKAVDYVIGGWQWNNVVITGYRHANGHFKRGGSERASGLPRGMQDKRLVACVARLFTGRIHSSRRAGWRSAPERLPGAGDLQLGHVPRKEHHDQRAGDDAVARPSLQPNEHAAVPEPGHQLSTTPATANGFGTLFSPRVSPPNRELELALRVSW
jgi:hypothetical protein